MPDEGELQTKIHILSDAPISAKETQSMKEILYYREKLSGTVLIFHSPQVASWFLGAGAPD